AQLGERSVRNAEVEGSNPFASTQTRLPAFRVAVSFSIRPTITNGASGRSTRSWGSRPHARSCSGDGERHHLFNVCCPCPQHHQAVKAQRDAGAVRQPRVHSVEKPRVRRQPRFALCLPERVLLNGPSAKFLRVGQFVIAV